MLLIGAASCCLLRRDRPRTPVTRAPATRASRSALWSLRPRLLGVKLRRRAWTAALALTGVQLMTVR
ncbi:hypothetical protein [Variovorax sp. dw_308]|uniref:hypothetical protein n=1 Tax=Variovorax sp. dw_308 TaxID=2721546 RepID=UPI001C458633|nr:hypothetical protein [Variovorax sp. dw_308]